MLRREFERFIDNAAFLYTLIALLFVSYSTRSYLVFLPLLFLLAPLTIKRLKFLQPLAIYSTIPFLVVVIPEGSFLSVPLAIMTPLILRKRIFRANNIEPSFLGPSSSAVVRYLVITSLLILVDPRLSLPIAIMFFSTLLYSSISYSKLSRIHIEVVNVPSTILLGQKATATIAIYSPVEAQVVFEYGFNKVLLSVDDKLITSLDLPVDHIGRHLIDVYVYAFDNYGFSGRQLAKFTVEYRVVPMTQRIIEITESYLRELRDLRSLISAVDLAVAELGPMNITTFSGVEAARIMRKIVHRGYMHPNLAWLIERFAATFEEITRETRENKYISRKSRRGEYDGVRQYVPGDSIKQVHWKKSLSKGFLVVKELSEDGSRYALNTSEVELEPIILVDLYAPNIYEFDSISFTLLKLCLELSRRSLTTRINVLLVIGEIALILSGKSIDVLYQLYKVFKDMKTQVLFNYKHIDELSEEAVEKLLRLPRKPRPVSIMVFSNNLYAEKLTEFMLKNNITPSKPFTIIYSESLRFKYTIVKRVLANNGFIYVEANALPNLIKRGTSGGP